MSKKIKSWTKNFNAQFVFVSLMIQSIVLIVISKHAPIVSMNININQKIQDAFNAKKIK
jgi:hypothetical protein